MDQSCTFEQGPIRPPSEAASLLIRVNRNCPWNRCTFCSVYKKTTFSLRPVADVIQDIDTIRRMIDAMLDPAGNARALMQNLSPNEEQAFYAARNWISCGMESIFLQDADSLVIRPENLLKILRHIKASFPRVKRITSYARSDSVARLGNDLIGEIAAAGLNRIHIGMETAADPLLALVHKGVTKEIHIKAGQMVKNAGIELSEYFLVGLGGSELSELHALESADALNQINPDFIRFRTLHLPDKITLYPESDTFRYRWAPDLAQVREIYTLLGHLEGITSCVKSDHSYNLLQEIDGVLPRDKERLLGVLERFMALSREEQVLFQVGKRAGHALRLADLESPGRQERVAEICRQAGITAENADERIYEIVQDRMRRGMPF